MRMIQWAFGCALGAMSVVACGGDDKIVSVIPGVETGKLQQTWTIEGTKDVTKCEQYKADRMRVVVLDAKGGVHATEFAPCGTFSLTLDLKTDSYTGNATFVNDKGYPISKTLPIPAFTIIEDGRVTHTLDFKAEDMKL